jgi:hypothetical protein
MADGGDCLNLGREAHGHIDGTGFEPLGGGDLGVIELEVLEGIAGVLGVRGGEGDKGERA